MERSRKKSTKQNKTTMFVMATAAFFLVITLIAAHADASEITKQSLKAQEVSAAQVDPVHQAIHKQLVAISSRDAELAFSMTTEKMHKKYNSPKEFLGKIRFEFRPIYNFKSYEFLDRHEINGGLLQKVSITDHSGEKAVAVYRMKRNSNGNWLIEAFSILFEDGQAI